MTRRSLFVLTGLIALLALGFTGLWLLTRDQAVRALEHEQLLANPSALPARPAGADAIEATAEAQAPERHVVEKLAAEKKPASLAALTPLEAELKNAFWVEGTVRFPDGAPPDEKITIEARGKKFSNDALHSVEVGRDGAYRVAFAAGTRTGWLRLKGRYSYLGEDQKVRLPAKGAAALEPIELAPLLGGCIRGRVTLPLGTSSQGTGLVGTQVRAWRMMFNPGDEVDERRNLAGEIGADERFEIGGVPGKSGWSLMIDADAFTRAQKSDVKVEPGKSVDVEIPLSTGARLAGQVVDEAGEPLAEANFSYQAPDAPGGGSWTNYHGKKSAADGKFDLRGTPTAKGTFSIEKEGFLPEHTEFASLTEGGGQQGLRVVLRRGNAIAGVVHWPDGQPVEGGVVTLAFTPEKPDENFSYNIFGGNAQTTKSDAQGKFRFTGLGRGTATLSAEAKAPAGKSEAPAKAVEAAADEKPDVADSEQPGGPKSKPAPKSLKGRKWTAIVEDVQAGTEGLVLTIDAGYSIQGRVVNSAGEPLKEFLVRAEPLEKARQEWAPVRGAISGRFSDADGRFTLEGLHEGEWLLRAEAKNTPACSPQQIRVPGTNSALTLTLASGCTVSGTVIDPKGKPVRSARVRVEPGREESSRFVFNGNKKFSTTSDADGRFEISGIPPGLMELQATSDEWAAPEPQALDLAPGQKREQLQILLRTPGRIVGLVLDQAGHTDAGRPISLNGSEGGGWQQTTSDSSGRFAFEKLAPGEYQVYTQAKQEEYAAAAGDSSRQNRVWQEQQRSTRTTVREGATSEITLGGLPKDALHLAGHVTCGGRAVASAYLQAWKHERSEGDEPREFHASADADGGFDLVLGGAGDYTINVNADASNASTSIRFEVKVGAEPRQTRDFELPGARIAGRVVDRAGKPQAQLSLQLTPDSKKRGERPGVSGNVTTDEQGRFQFEHVAPGTYEIVCGGSDMDWRPGARTGRTTRSGLVVEAGKSLEGIEIVAQPACRVEGTVTGPDGAPVAGAAVMVVDEQGNSLVGWQRELTDGSGHFDFDAIQPGRAAFLAQKGTLTSGYSGWVMIQEAEATKVECALVNGSMVFVETNDASGAPVRADIQVFDSRGLDVSEAGRWSNVEVEALPGRRFGPLAPGKYTAIVMRREKPDLRQEFSVGGDPRQALRVVCD